MSFLEAAQAPLRKYFVFSGRSSRMEYWSFTLAVTIALVGVALAMVLTEATVVLILYLGLYLGVLIPFLTVAVRRLHDTNHSGWWLLVGLIPFGSFVLLYFVVQASDPGVNQYGPNPNGHTGEQAITPSTPSGDGWLAPKG